MAKVRVWSLLGLTALACKGEPTAPALGLCDSARELRPSASFTTVAEEADIAAKVLSGGFGGLFQERGGGAASDGILVAYFKDTSDPALKNSVQTLLRCGAVYPGWAGVLVTTDLGTIAIRKGQYTATELLSYYRALESLKVDTSVWGLEVDPEANRVWIGITNHSQLVRIEQAVSTRDVPLAAVSIESPPPSTGLEQFEVLDTALTTRSGENFGTIVMVVNVRFTNRQASTRYPDWCVGPWPYFLYTLEKWNGSEWRFVRGFVCVAVQLPPRAVLPGQSVIDSVQMQGARKLNTIPEWLTARITGTYRIVGRVYTSTTPDPSGGNPILSDPAPPDEQVSAPFRVTNTLPF